MKSSPLIDLIIPVYNRAAIVGKTLQSIERQTLLPARVILVDNNSTDSTADVLGDWAEKMKERGVTVHVLTETAPGAAAARNRGLDASTAEYVMFFDSDDVMLPTHVESFADSLAADPSIDIAGKDVMMTLLDGRKKRGHFMGVKPEFFNVFTGQFATQRYVVRRSLLDRAGRWNPAVRGWDDIELGQRLLLCNPKITVVKGAPTVNVEVMADSITESRFSDNPAKWEKALDEMRRTATEAGRRRLVDWIDCSRMILAASYYTEGKGDEATRLRNNVLEDNTKRSRLNLVYNYHRRFRRFTWVLCRLIF